MPNLKWIAVVAIAALTQIAVAQQQSNVTMMKAPGKAMISGTSKVTATVEAIDPDSRVVTLKRHDGKLVEVEVGEEARNFDQLKVGDVVTAVYHQALTLSLKKGGAGQPSVEETPSVERTPAGAKPGGTIGHEVKIMTDVVDVNHKTHTVTLKGPKGGLVDLKVEDPAELANIKKGDQVEAVYTEALAISVTPAPQK
jgi:Cu/Ag efflux protein CusF